MKAWKKGAILGALWGIVASLSYLTSETAKPPLAPSTPLGKVLLIAIAIFWIPIWSAVLLGFRFQLVFIGAPIAGALFGAVLGHLYGKLRKQR